MIASSQRTMWQAALLQTVEDAINGVPGPRRDAEKRLNQIKAARAYLTEPNKDCDMVCTMAGIEPDALRRRIQLLLLDADTPEELVEQQRRTGLGKSLTLHGETKTITEWADHLDMNANVISQRLKAGHSAEKALTPGRLKTGRRKMKPSEGSWLSSDFTDKPKTGV